MKMPQSTVEHADSSNLCPSLPSADSTCFVSTLTNSASRPSACEDSHNVGAGVNTQEREESQSNVSSTEERHEKVLKIGESGGKSTLHAKLIRPLYKYMKDKKCLLCGFKSEAKDLCSARKHLLVHITNKDFKCDICEKRFSTEMYMVRHRVVHSDVFPFSCDLCHKKYRSLSCLINHKKKIHVQKRNWKCKTCDKNFTKKEYLTEHLRLHTVKRPRVCPLCKKTFQVKRDFMKHIYTWHGSHELQQCSLTLASSSDLVNHECASDANLIQNRNERPTSYTELIRPLYKYMKNKKCLLCGFESKAKNLHCARSHLLVHVTNKDFKCDLCEKIFSRWGDMLNHRFVHSDVFPFSCDLCDKKCRDKRSLSNHKRSVHKPKRKCKCEFCGKVFNYRETLKQHLRIHTGERPYVCPICEEAFRFSQGLRKHHRKQHGSNQCSQCGLFFASRSDLDEHECKSAENVAQNILFCHDSENSAVISTSQSDAYHVDSSNLRIPLPPADSASLIANCASTSSARENTHNISTEVCTQERRVPECNVESAEQRPENILEIGTFDNLGEYGEGPTSYAKLIRPLYKYMKNKKCLLCGFESQAEDLCIARQHLLIHIKNKVFECDICGKKFSTKNYMLKHRLVHSNTFPISCDVCDKKFRNKNGMYSHKKAVHAQKRWKCEVCDKDFCRKFTLKEHLRIHTGELPHVCWVCKEAFRTKYALATHARLQHSFVHNDGPI